MQAWILNSAGASANSSPGDIGHYLLMKPIENALKTGNFKILDEISEKRISVDLESPFELNGYLPTEKLIDSLAHIFSKFETKNIEWVSRQLEEKFSVQSLNLVLKNKQSEKYEYYKIILFLTKKENKEWKIYYLRGLKI